MELALRSLQIGYFIKDWKNMWSFLNRIALSIQSDSPSSSQQTSHEQAAGTILGMRHLPSSFVPTSWNLRSKKNVYTVNPLLSPLPQITPQFQ